MRNQLSNKLYFVLCGSISIKISSQPLKFNWISKSGSFLLFRLLYQAQSFTAVLTRFKIMISPQFVFLFFFQTKIQQIKEKYICLEEKVRFRFIDPSLTNKFIKIKYFLDLQSVISHDNLQVDVLRGAFQIKFGTEDFIFYILR